MPLHMVLLTNISDRAAECIAKSECTYLQANLALHSLHSPKKINLLSRTIGCVLTLSQTTNFRLSQIERVCRRQS